MLEITVPDTSYSTQRVNINNTVYNLQLSFNNRDSSWYLDLFDINNSPILQSKKLQFGSPITSRYILPNLIDGDFFILKTEERDQVLGRSNFGVGKLYNLVYLTQADQEVLFG